MKKNNTFIYLIIGGGVLLLVVALLLLFQPDAQQQPEINLPTNPQVAESDEEIPRASLQESKTAFDDTTAVFLDVRSTGSYAAGHIPRSVHIPESELPSRMNDLDPEQKIITYCT